MVSCKAITKKGKRCKKYPSYNNFCHIHKISINPILKSSIKSTSNNSIPTSITKIVSFNIHNPNNIEQQYHKPYSIPSISKNSETIKHSSEIINVYSSFKFPISKPISTITKSKIIKPKSNYNLTKYIILFLPFISIFPLLFIIYNNINISL